MVDRLDTSSPGRNVAAVDLSALRIDDTKRKSRPVGKWLGLFAAMLGVILIVMGTVWALRSRKPEVTVAAAMQPSDAVGASILLNASGYVTPRRRATVAAKITGKVKQVFIDEGMHV